MLRVPVAGSVLSVAWAVTALAVSQQPTPSPSVPKFAGSTTSVVLDVVVRDRGARPVSGLTSADFEVYDNGRKQEIATFVAIDRPSPGISGQPDAEHQKLTAAQDEAATTIAALVFDQLDGSGRNLAVKAALQYVRTSVGHGRRAAVFVADRGLRVLVPYTDNVAALEKGVMTAAQKPGYPMVRVGTIPNADQDSSVDRATSEDDPFARAHATMDGLAAVIKSIAEFRGRKCVVYFSQGIALGSPEDQPILRAGAPRDLGPAPSAVGNWLTDNRHDHFLHIFDLANEARVAFYTFDAGGLRTESPMDPDYGRSPYAGLQMLADETGGAFVESTNDLVTGVDRVIADLGTYYLLGFTTTQPADGRYHRLEVKCRRHEYRLLARRGYVAKRR
jgi:VWFA-related protein